MLVNMASRLAVIEVIAVRITIEMMDAISAYSIAVAPPLSTGNRLKAGRAAWG